MIELVEMEGRRTPNFHQFKTGHGTLPKPAKQTYAFNTQRDGGLNKIPLVTYSIFFFSGSVPRLLAEKSRLFQVQRPPEKSETPSESQETHSHCLPDSLISEKFQKFWNFGKFQSSKKKCHQMGCWLRKSSTR